jgi:hypothetical protein
LNRAAPKPAKSLTFRVATDNRSPWPYFAPGQGFQLVKGRDRQCQNVFQEPLQLRVWIGLDALLDFPQHNGGHPGIGSRHLAQK